MDLLLYGEVGIWCGTGREHLVTCHRQSQAREWRFQIGLPGRGLECVFFCVFTKNSYKYPMVGTRYICLIKPQSHAGTVSLALEDWLFLTLLPLPIFSSGLSTHSYSFLIRRGLFDLICLAAMAFYSVFIIWFLWKNVEPYDVINIGTTCQDLKTFSQYYSLCAHKSIDQSPNKSPS